MSGDNSNSSRALTVQSNCRFMEKTKRLQNDAVDGAHIELFLGKSATGGTHGVDAGRIDNETFHGVGELHSVVHGNQVTVLSSLDGLATTRSVGRNDRAAHRHRFEDRAWNAFTVIRRQYINRGSSNRGSDIIELTKIIN